MRFFTHAGKRAFYVMMAFVGLFWWFVAGLLVYCQKMGINEIPWENFFIYGFRGMLDPLAIAIGVGITLVLGWSLKYLRKTAQENPDELKWLNK